VGDALSRFRRQEVAAFQAVPADSVTYRAVQVRIHSGTADQGGESLLHLLAALLDVLEDELPTHRVRHISWLRAIHTQLRRDLFRSRMRSATATPTAHICTTIAPTFGAAVRARRPSLTLL